MRLAFKYTIILLCVLTQTGCETKSWFYQWRSSSKTCDLMHSGWMNISIDCDITWRPKYNVINYIKGVCNVNFMFALIVSSQPIWAYRIFTTALNYHQSFMLFLTCGLYQKASVSKVWIVAHCMKTLTLLSEP